MYIIIIMFVVTTLVSTLFMQNIENLNTGHSPHVLWTVCIYYYVQEVRLDKPLRERKNVSFVDCYTCQRRVKWGAMLQHVFTDTCVKWRVLEILVQFFFFFHYENASGCLSRNPYPLKLNWKNSILHDRRHYVHALCERLWNISFFFFFSLFIFFPSLCSIERDCGKFCGSGVSHVALVCDSWTMEEKGKVLWSMVLCYLYTFA